MSDDKKVEDQLFKAFEDVAHRELLPLLKEEFVQRFKNGAILLHYDIRYRRDIEEAGVPWDEFIDFAFTTSYQMIMDEHARQMLKEQEQSETEETLKTGIKMKTMAQINK